MVDKSYIPIQEIEHHLLIFKGFEIQVVSMYFSIFQPFHNLSVQATLMISKTLLRKILKAMYMKGRADDHPIFFRNHIAPISHA